jgi:hypothetical protein
MSSIYPSVLNRPCDGGWCTMKNGSGYQVSTHILPYLINTETNIQGIRSELFRSIVQIHSSRHLWPTICCPRYFCLPFIFPQHQSHASPLLKLLSCLKHLIIPSRPHILSSVLVEQTITSRTCSLAPPRSMTLSSTWRGSYPIPRSLSSRRRQGKRMGGSGSFS